MTVSDFRASLRARGPETWIAVLGLGIALSPANTKIAGAAWLFICIAGVIAFFKGPEPAGSDRRDAASKAWAVACTVTAVLASVVALYWPDRPDTLHAEFRLLLAAVATHQLIRRTPCPEIWRAYTLPAVALASVAALGIIGTAQDRMAVPSNPIPWAVAMALLLCILLPPVLGGACPPGQRKWYFLSIALGLAAIFLSQSRGAFGILVWATWLTATSWKRSHANVSLRKAVAAGLAGIALLASSAWLPSDPLRLREGWNQVVTAKVDANYNSSMGARVYLWTLALKGIQDSPWIGIGGRERLKRIKAAGNDLPEAQRERFKEVRNVGHVHNQYLHSAMDGGLVGLASALAVLAGLGAAAFRLRQTDPVASRQMQGVLFMHATAGLTNVNMAHNYYAIMLSLSVTLILAGAGSRSGSPLQRA
jgi:O-antigen ligase